MLARVKSSVFKLRACLINLGLACGATGLRAIDGCQLHCGLPTQFASIVFVSQFLVVWLKIIWKVDFREGPASPNETVAGYIVGLGDRHVNNILFDKRHWRQNP